MGRLGGERESGSRGLVRHVFAGEWTCFEVFDCVFNHRKVEVLFATNEVSECASWVVDPRPYSSQPVSGVFEEGACADDVVTGLEGGGVVGGVAARAEEERQGFVFVFPDGLFEVFTCWCMVSAHLGELGEKFAIDVFEPFGRS